MSFFLPRLLITARCDSAGSPPLTTTERPRRDERMSAHSPVHPTPARQVGNEVSQGKWKRHRPAAPRTEHGSVETTKRNAQQPCFYAATRAAASASASACARRVVMRRATRFDVQARAQHVRAAHGGAPETGSPPEGATPAKRAEPIFARADSSSPVSSSSNSGAWGCAGSRLPGGRPRHRAAVAPPPPVPMPSELPQLGRVGSPNGTGRRRVLRQEKHGERSGKEWGRAARGQT